MSPLAAIADAFIPGINRPGDADGYWARSGSAAGVPQRIDDALARIKEEDRLQFKQLMGLLDSRLLGLTWGGPLKPVQQLTPEQRTKMLQRWSASPLNDLRSAFNALRKLCGLIYFGDVGADGENPNWKSIGYKPLEGVNRPDPAPLNLSVPPSSGVIDCEVLVIGSGAGGSVVAARLAAAGRDVVILDKGGYTPVDRFSQREFPTLQSHFEAGALLTSVDGGISLLAGSTVGGGTTINWSACLRTPDEVLEEWAAFGNPQFNDKAYLQGFEFIERRNSIHTNYEHNAPNNALLAGAGALGYNVAAIPLNLRFPDDLPKQTAWESQGFSCFGDRYGIKQGAPQTFLHDALAHGARLYAGADLKRILVRNGAAAGAEAVAVNGSGQAQALTIRAQKVVVAAGALQSPVLLLKSGLRHPQIGRNLWLHPVSATAAFFDREMYPWHGPMMSVVVRQFERLEDNYGVRLEVPPLHPGLAAFALPWVNGENYKDLMLRIKQLGVQIAITRDRFGGRVRVGKHSGQPVIDYTLSRYDRRHLLRGILESVRMQAAAGAAEILVPHNRPLVFRPAQDDWNRFTAEFESRRWRTGDFPLFSAHQMGTCRMGGTADCPVKPDGETREVRGLYLADGSLFPTASGVNPMLSIQALAYYVGGMI